MFKRLTEAWNKYGFAGLVVASLLFFILCWFMGWKPKKGRADRVSDYVNYFLGVKPERKKRNPKKTEERCRQIVEDIFQVPFPSKRPDFLRNPETGRNLECDMMNPDLKLCIERNGEQHYKHVEHFHTTEQYAKQLERDRLKQKLLQQNGYTLITIPYYIHYDVLEQHIPQILEAYPRYKPYVDSYRQRHRR